MSWLAYIVIAILVITAVSNGANLTDGLDGLSAGVSATIVVVLGILAYLSGNIIYADYLNIMYIPTSGELVVFAAAFAGALFGFYGTTAIRLKYSWAIREVWPSVESSPSSPY